MEIIILNIQYLEIDKQNFRSVFHQLNGVQQLNKG